MQESANESSPHFTNEEEELLLGEKKRVIQVTQIPSTFQIHSLNNQLNILGPFDFEDETAEEEGLHLTSLSSR